MRPGLVTQFGEPIRPSRPNRPQGLGQVGYQQTAWDAASYATEETRDWNAWLASPDIENNFARDTIVARIRDLVRNDGWAAGAITRITDGVVGGDMRPIAKPDWRYLSMFNPACDESWAKEFGRAAEALYRSWSTDMDCWCDASQRHTMSQLFRLAFRSKLVDGEALAVLLWIPQRRRTGRARYSTALQVIDSDRLSNPQLGIDTRTRRAGVELDDYGAPLAYWIRQAHMGDWFNPAASVTWDRFERATDFGRRIVLHDFDADRPGEHRPAGGILKPVLGRMKMLSRYDSVELQAAVINAVFSAYIESPNDPETVAEALGADTDGPSGWNNYQSARQEYHDAKKLKLSGARIPTLFPGEKIVGVDGKRPSTNYAAFENACLRNVATATGISAEQISQDWSKTNYSSARASLMEAWKTLKRRRQDFASGFASPVYAAFLEEAVDRGELPMPAGAPDFIEARAAYAACTWMGPPLGWVDPVKEAQAAVLRMDAGLSTLQDECALQGLDYEEVIAQRSLEVRAFKEAGLIPPTWYGQPAQEVEQKPLPQ